MRTPVKYLLPAILAFLGASGSLDAAEFGIVVTGVRDSGGVTSVRLMNSATGAAAWMAVGQTFGGYVISSYDSRSDSVVLVRNNVRVMIPLRTPQVQNSRGGGASGQPAAPPSPQPAPPAVSSGASGAARPAAPPATADTPASDSSE